MRAARNEKASHCLENRAMGAPYLFFNGKSNRRKRIEPPCPPFFVQSQHSTVYGKVHVPNKKNWRKVRTLSIYRSSCSSNTILTLACAVWGRDRESPCMQWETTYEAVTRGYLPSHPIPTVLLTEDPSLLVCGSWLVTAAYAFTGSLLMLPGSYITIPKLFWYQEHLVITNQMVSGMM